MKSLRRRRNVHVFCETNFLLSEAFIFLDNYKRRKRIRIRKREREFNTLFNLLRYFMKDCVPEGSDVSIHL